MELPRCERLELDLRLELLGAAPRCAVIRALPVGPVQDTVGRSPCAAPGRAPRLSADDPVLGQPFDLTLHDATAGTVAVLLLSAPAALPVPGTPCLLYADPLSALVVPFRPTAPTWTLPLAAPALPALAGLSLGLQVVAAPTAGPLGADFSGGLTLTFGTY